MNVILFHMRIKTLIVLCCFSVINIVSSQVNSDSGQAKAKFLEVYTTSFKLSDSILNMQIQLEQVRLKTMESQEKYYQKQYEYYYPKMLEHNWATFNWQYNSGIIIFWMTIIIVFIGIIFSGIQFYFTLKQLKIKETLLSMKIQDQAPTFDNKSEIEVSLQGIKVNSSVLGVIILVISIAFFYLYLIYVYPINKVKTENNQIKTEKNIDK